MKKGWAIVLVIVAVCLQAQLSSLKDRVENAEVDATNALNRANAAFTEAEYCTWKASRP